MTDPELDALVAAAKGGDRDALDHLLRDSYDRLSTLCRRLMGDPTDAEDATQDALVAIARGIRSFDGRSAFSTWCYRVTTNVCLDEHRRRARRPRTVRLDVLPDRPGGVGSMEEALLTEIDVNSALARLPEEFRVAVVLRDLCGLDYAEIADLASCPPGTVRSRIARGRRMLVDLLGNQNPDANVEGAEDE